MKLVLFDIDGTLIRDDGAAREAYAIALREVYGFERGMDDHDFSGKTDPQITHEVLGRGGFSVDQIESGMADLWSCYLGELAARANQARIRLLDGVCEILDILKNDRSVILGLLTGNIEPGARIKLAPHSLNAYFPFGAFGSDSPRRDELPPIAVERAARSTGHQFSEREIVIIGDSIWDVRCGVPHKATTIAVASGRTPAEALQAERPDHFFPDLRPTDEIVAAIVG